MATTDLGKWMITNGGNYSPEAVYEQLTMVMYDNSTYITLKTVTGVTPSNDGINYILMAQGFNATALSAVTAVDTSGLLGSTGETISAQSLIDYLADAVSTKLLKKSDISTTLSSSDTTVPASSLLKTTDDKIGDISNLPVGASNVVEAIAQQNSNFQVKTVSIPSSNIPNYVKGYLQYTTYGKWVLLQAADLTFSNQSENDIAENIISDIVPAPLQGSAGCAWSTIGYYSSEVHISETKLYIRTVSNRPVWGTLCYLAK